VTYVGRFAPSPSGPLHAGSLVAALASWLDARAHGGRWLLRMEDVDTPRTVPGAADAIMAQLDALGLHWDGGVMWQSQRNAAYQAALDEVGTVYEEKFATIKADPAARKRVQDEKNQDTEDHFLHKLDTLLTPAQKDAMTKAAEEEQRRGAASPKKPVK